MMLWIVRHADAEPTAPGASDFDRALSRRGRDDCARMVRALSARGTVADCIVASDALRARTTAELLAPGFGRAPRDVRLEHELYRADGGRLLERLRELPGEARTVVLVGHNPAVSELATLLAGDAIRHGLTTLGIVAVEVGESWTDLGAARARIRLRTDPAACARPGAV